MTVDVANVSRGVKVNLQAVLFLFLVLDKILHTLFIDVIKMNYHWSKSKLAVGTYINQIKSATGLCYKLVQH